MKNDSFYLFCLHVLTPLGRSVFWIKYKGTENIPEDGSFILCSNHKSVCDPFFLAVPFKRQIRYMAKTELFTDHGPVARCVLYALGAFPVKRSSSDLRSVRQAENLLKYGEIVGVFPQGKCIYNDLPFAPKAGAALIAAKSKVPILPAAVCMHGRLRPFKHITVRFGKMIRCSDFPVKSGGRADIRALADMLADRINELLGAGI